MKTIRLKLLAGVKIEELHYKVISLVPIDGIEINKSYRISPITLMKFEKKKITLAELKAEYYRDLDARGKHLIIGEIRDLVLTCKCENNTHIGHCAVGLLKSYTKVKEDIMTLEDMEKVDLQAEWDNAVPVYVKCPDCGHNLEDDEDEDGLEDSYCPKCDDVKKV